MPKFHAIAECEVIRVSTDGESRTISLSIGVPRPLPEGGWECPVAADGLYVDLPPIRGVDSWHALILAVRLLEELLSSEIARGSVLHWPDGGSPLTTEELFSRSQHEDEAE
jgi:uncharacterized protein DUF6968